MRTLMFVVAIAAAAPACTVDDPNTSSSNQRVELKNRLSSNRLSSNRLSSNRLSSNRLSSNSLDSTKLTALQETAQILETADGRDVYSYIISCALPADATIIADLNYLAPPPADTNCTDPGPNGEYCPNYSCTGGVCSFFGNAGLAPRWIDHKLGNADAGWVSACIFSRVNYYEVAEAISLRGRNAALTVSPEEAAEFSLEEGAFYGNLFINDPDPSHPPDWNACKGEDKAANPYPSTFVGLNNRRCAEENPMNLGFTYCGFKYHGDCRDFDTTTPSPHACSSYDGTYNDCHDSLSSDKGKWHRSTNYRQVITTYISNI